jgi:hypothetical protein
MGKMYPLKLYGLLVKVRDLGLTLISVDRVEDDESPETAWCKQKKEPKGIERKSENE